MRKTQGRGCSEMDQVRESVPLERFQPHRESVPFCESPVIFFQRSLQTFTTFLAVNSIPYHHCRYHYCPLNVTWINSGLNREKTKVGGGCRFERQGKRYIPSYSCFGLKFHCKSTVHTRVQTKQWKLRVDLVRHSLIFLYSPHPLTHWFSFTSQWLYKWPNNTWTHTTDVTMNKLDSLYRTRHTRGEIRHWDYVKSSLGVDHEWNIKQSL